jgi:hypothetical protein
MMEHLLTIHPFQRQIAQLPDSDIERLRELVREAASLGFAPHQVYDAITQGFERVCGPLVASPPLADAWAELSQEANRLQELA